MFLHRGLFFIRSFVNGNQHCFYNQRFAYLLFAIFANTLRHNLDMLDVISFW